MSVADGVVAGVDVPVSLEDAVPVGESVVLELSVCDGVSVLVGEIERGIVFEAVRVAVVVREAVCEDDAVLLAVSESVVVAV